MSSKMMMFLATFTITLCIGRIAKGQDLYGPPLPPGFVEPKTMSAAAPPAVPKSESIGFWGQIKAALTSTIGRVIPGNGDSESSDYQKLDVSGRTPTSVSKISSPEADRKIVALVNESIEQSNRLTRLLKDPSTLEFETTKPLLTIAAQEPALRIELHKKYSPESSPKESITFASDTFTNNARLLPLSDKAIIPVTAVHIDELKLVRALLAIVGDKNDNAGDQLHRLGTGTKAEIVKLKSLAFLGHLLFEQNIPTLAATSLVRALDPSQNSPEGLKFNSYTLETLSKVARGQLSAKTLIRPNVFEKIIDHSGLSDEARSFASLVLAERAFDSGRFESARKLAQGIAPKSSWSERGRYLAALCIYAAKPENRASQELAGRELTDLFRTVEDPAVFDAVATALGRIHFILGNYKAANQYLEQVTKETNIWLESAVDNGWSLLKSGDKHHAVGNMFTLHTPYFEGAYMPDSYFLQTLGYQELCQFGDAFTSVKKYKLMYVPLTKSVTEFNASAKKSSTAHYDAVIAFLSKQPPQMHPVALRELARHPEFIKRQTALNLIAREERNVELLFPSAGKRIFSWAKSALDETRNTFKLEMAKFLRARALNMEEELKFVNSNMALLEYEIYAGASQNLAMQAAQNFAVNEKEAAKNRPDDDGKEYWPYEEEVWEDELNNFRSKIVDGCAKNRKPAAS